MTRAADTTRRKPDWVVLACCLFLTVFGWLNIYSASCVDDVQVFEWGARYGMQLIWIAVSAVISLLILHVIPTNFYPTFARETYILMALLLIATIIVGADIKGSHSWLVLGPIRLQPAEFSKITTALALAALMETYDFRFDKPRSALQGFGVMLAPVLLILLQHETGLALVYLGFLLCFYREGMSGQVILAGFIAIGLFILTLVASPHVALTVMAAIAVIFGAGRSHFPGKVLLYGAGIVLFMGLLPLLWKWRWFAQGPGNLSPATWIAILAIPLSLFFAIRLLIVRHKRYIANALLAFLFGAAVVFSADWAMSHLKEHQRLRVESLLGLRDDPTGVGYNVHQSKIAIGSGGFAGKGFLDGTQTRMNFVPEQTTDFIFCTVGEEWGFLGSLAILAAFLILIIRIYNRAEQQKSRFNRIYGYCLASCLLMHVTINIGMTIGLMPVIGIPLPFVSYGGSSMLAFSIMTAIWLRLDMENR